MGADGRSVDYASIYEEITDRYVVIFLGGKNVLELRLRDELELYDDVLEGFGVASVVDEKSYSVGSEENSSLHSVRVDRQNAALIV